MEGKKQERYSLMGPGGGISAVSMEAGEFHLFGNSCTTIITTETDSYPVIEDEPGKLEVVDNTEMMSGIGHGIANGLLLCAGVVLFAGATAATGGAALLLGGCVLGGASFGVSAATDGMVESDRETGNDRSWGDFALGVAGGGVAGATTGAVLYGTVMAAPVAGLAAGMDAAAVIGPSAFTTTVVPAIITGGGYGLAGATALYVENDIRARNGGYNLLLDKVFDNNTDKYEECGMILMLGNNVYMEYGAMNMNRMPGGDSKESFGNNQSVQKLKAQNSMSGTGGGNAGSGGGASPSGFGGQTKTGVLFGKDNEVFDDYMDLVETLDVSTSANTAIFYSGPGNRALAEKFANLNNKTTLEMTPGGAYLDNLNLFLENSPLTPEEATNVWARLSARYAQGANGNTYGFVNGSRPDSIFNTVEYPELINNSEVTNIFTEFMR